MAKQKPKTDGVTNVYTCRAKFSGKVKCDDKQENINRRPADNYGNQIQQDNLHGFSLSFVLTKNSSERIPFISVQLKMEASLSFNKCVNCYRMQNGNQY